MRKIYVKSCPDLVNKAEGRTGLWYNLFENVMEIIRSKQDELELARMVAVVVSPSVLGLCDPLYSGAPVDANRKDGASF
ncbi:hypothetical protein LFLT20_22280 [Limosilactobacillus fermentum]|nr:hypothetical protein LFLT20_22280 [Limosilactobacillus fermentum]